MSKTVKQRIFSITFRLESVNYKRVYVMLPELCDVWLLSGVLSSTDLSKVHKNQVTEFEKDWKRNAGGCEFCEYFFACLLSEELTFRSKLNSVATITINLFEDSRNTKSAYP